MVDGIDDHNIPRKILQCVSAKLKLSEGLEVMNE